MMEIYKRIIIHLQLHFLPFLPFFSFCILEEFVKVIDYNGGDFVVGD